MKKTEQSLKELVERYRDIVDNLLDVIVEVDAKGKFIFVSPQVHDILGFRPEELIGLSVYEFIHPEDLSYFKEALDKALKLGDPLIVELELSHKKGHYVSVSMKGRVVNHNSNIKIICVLSDITEHKEVEHTSNIILEKIREGYYSVDLKGNFTFVNDYYCKVLGYTRKELLGKNYQLIYDEKSSKKLFKLFNQIYKSGIPLPHTNFAKLVTKKGKQVFFEGLLDLIYDSEGNKVGFYGLVRDISKRKEVEKRLKIFKKNYRALLEEIMEGYYTIDLKGNYTFVNDYYCKIIGYTREELLGKNYGPIFDEKSSKRLFKIFTQVYESGIPLPHIKRDTVKPNKGKQVFIEGLITNRGKQIFLEGLIDLIYDSEGNKVGFFGFVRDITEHKEAEQKLKESERVLIAIVKELTTLYELSKLIETLDISLEDVIQSTLNLIPTAWQFPEITTARIKYKDKLYSLENFEETKWKMSIKTMIKKFPILIEVCYLEDKPFINQEYNLLTEIGIQLKRIIEGRDIQIKLKESEKKYREILEDIQEGYYSLDLKGNYTHVNDYWCKILGYSKEELLGKNFRLLFDEKTSRELFKVFNQLYKSGIPLPHTNRAEGITSKGKQIFLEGLIDLIYDSEENKIGFYGFARDITEKVIAEQKLKESERKYREILENINEGYYEMDLYGNYTFASDFYCKALGFSKEELLGRNARLIFDEKSMKNYNKLFTELYKTGISFPPSNIIEVSTTRGKKISFEGSADLIYDSEGNKVGYFGLARDVSERIHAEQKLEESEKKYRKLLEDINEGYYNLDLKGKYTYVNEYYCRAQGYSKEEVLGKNFRLLYDDKTSKELFKMFNQLYKSGIPLPHTNRAKMITKRGKKLFLEGLIDLIYDSEGTKIGFYGFARDVTEKVIAEQKLKESENKLKERIKEINCLYGISKLIEKPYKSVDEMIQNTIELIPPAWQFPDLACARINFNYTEFKTKNFEETKWKFSASTEINQKELGIEVYYLKNIPFLEEEKHLTKDIINRLKVIIEKKQAEDNLRQFISIVSHELRTPVTVLIQSTDVLNKYKDKLSKEKKKEINEMMSRNISLLYDLVDDLLVTSRIDEKGIKLTGRKYQPLNLILEIVELMDPRRETKDITIEVYVDKEIQLYGDIRRISQIFRILIDNAIKYSHENSNIVLIGIEHYKGKYNSNGIDGVLFQFKDFGVGIHEEDLPQLFQRFFRAKNVQRIAGTGLGLCIAKDLIELHNGEIFVESKYGKGTTFSVFLPYLKNI